MKLPNEILEKIFIHLEIEVIIGLGASFDFIAKKKYENEVKFLEHDDVPFLWNNVWMDAVEHGRLDVVKWLHKNKKEMNDKSVYECDCECDVKNSSLIDFAAGYGQLEIIEWFLKNNKSMKWTPCAMVNAIHGGHFEMVKWLHMNRHKTPYNCNTNCALEIADLVGEMEIFKWIHTHREDGISNTGAFIIAAERGLLEAVKWLHKYSHQKLILRAIQLAEDNEHVHVVEWLSHNPKELNSSVTCTGLTKKGNMCKNVAKYGDFCGIHRNNI